MALIQSKQVKKNQAAYVGLSNQTVSSANSLNITTALTNALSTAGDGGVSVPLQPGGSSSIEGVITGSTSTVPVFSSPDGEPVIIAGEQVYGIITYSSSTYTVSFYTSPNGVQTAATINQAVDLFIPYMFTFEHYPSDALLRIQISEPGGSAAGTGTDFNDAITPSGTNTFPNLTNLPLKPSAVRMTVNGQTFYAGTHFTVTGQAVTQSAGQITAVGFNVVPSDSVVFEYQY